jgi:hypothetical protein
VPRWAMVPPDKVRDPTCDDVPFRCAQSPRLRGVHGRAGDFPTETTRSRDGILPGGPAGVPIRQEGVWFFEASALVSRYGFSFAMAPWELLKSAQLQAECGQWSHRELLIWPQ